MAAAGLSLAACASVAAQGPAPTVAGAAQGQTYAAREPKRDAPAWSPEGLPTDAKGRVRAYNRPYQVKGVWYSPAAEPDYDEVGIASWYGYESGHTTANGEAFLTDERATAAHRTLPIPSRLQVTNLDNGKSIEVRLNDRGPYAPGRMLDVSREAARELGFLEKGTAHVRVRYLGPAPIDRALQSMQVAEITPSRQIPLAPERARPAAVLVAPPKPEVKDPMELVAGLP